MGVSDPVVGDAQLIQAIGPLLQFVAATARESHMIETGAALIEGFAGRLGVGVQPEQMPARKGIDGVVERAALFVLVENRVRTEQRGVLLRTAVQVADSHRDVRQRGELGHGSCLLGVRANASRATYSAFLRSKRGPPTVNEALRSATAQPSNLRSECHSAQGTPCRPSRRCNVRTDSRPHAASR